VKTPIPAWPRPAQLAAAFLLGMICALIGERVLHSASARPLDSALSPALDLNRATAGELLQLPGVGPVLANRIVSTRDDRGGFDAADDLRTVNGIGPARLDRVRPWVRNDAPSLAPAKQKPVAFQEAIDLNLATVDQLRTLPGVGAKIAQRIIDERGKRPFASADDLRRVSGIGPKTLEKLRPFVTVKPVE